MKKGEETDVEGKQGIGADIEGQGQENGTDIDDI